jgi:hypothetical protein
LDFSRAASVGELWFLPRVTLAAAKQIQDEIIDGFDPDRCRNLDFR